MDVTEWLAGIGAWAAMLLPAVIVFGLWGLILWRGMRRRLRDIKRHEADGTIGRAAYFQSGEMPGHYELVARIGTGGPAATSLFETVLRPAIGVRLVVLIVGGTLIYYCLQPAFWQSGFGAPDRDAERIFGIARILLPAMAGYAVLYIFTSEARYDRDVLIVTRLLQRREYRWAHLQRIGDGGAYDLVLFFKPGGKAKVLKHSAGIEAFKAFAMAQVQKNRVAHA